MESPRKIENMLSQIYEGMAVYDADNQKIGSVTDIQFGAEVDEQAPYGSGPATASDQDTSADKPGQNVVVPLPLASAGAGVGGSTGWVGVVPGLTFEDEIPQPLRQRLLRTGFIKIKGGGIVGGARYITPEQIAAIRDKNVYLSVLRAQLVKDDSQV